MQSDADILNTLINAPEVMIWMTDERHLCVYVNPTLAKFSGQEAHQMYGLDWMRVVHPDDRDRIQEKQIRAKKSPHNFRQEFRVLAPDGQIRWVLDLGVARFDRKRKFLGYVGLVTDITEQKSAELELLEQRRELERQILEISDREKRRIGQDLHDGLSQRLLAVSLECGLLQEKLSLRNPSAASSAGKILTEVSRAIQDIREVSRSLSPIFFGDHGLANALQELFHYVRTRFRTSIRVRGLPRNFGMDPDADIHLYRIIQEALTNAVRHGRAKQIEIFFYMRENRGLEVKIRDHGKGPPAKPGKTGMGLATMQYRAELLRGTFSFERAPGKGTELRLRIPEGKRRSYDGHDPKRLRNI